MLTLGAAPPADTVYDQQIRPFLMRHCLECHGTEKPKGELRLDQLSADFADAAGREHWLDVLKRITAGEMPPEKKPRPSDKEVQIVADWIRQQVATARRAEGRVVLRRLNRVEYENTVRDLLGIELDLKEMLPLDTAADGFDNVGEALHTSSFLMERYLDAADAALNVAIVNGPQPKLLQKRYSLKDTHQVKSTTERVFRKSDDGTVVMFSSSPWQSITVSPFYPQDRGRYRIRISACGIQSAGKPVTYRVDAGLMLMGSKPHLVGYFDVPPDEPTVVEFVESLDPRNTIRISPFGLATAQAVDKIGAEEYDGAGLAVQWVDVEGPLHEVWPPESHRQIFGDLAQATVPVPGNRNHLEVVSTDPVRDAERILRSFTRRAFRRAVTDDDVKPFVALVESKLAEKATFEQAVRVALKAVMVSPEFLFLREQPGQLNDFALASRLSYFLWSTMPDEELLALAERGELSGRGGEGVRGSKKSSVDSPSPPHPLAPSSTLHAQVERLLNHPRAAAFTENFVSQWLGLRDIDFTVPDRRLYPEFDDMLKAAMVQEPLSFFDELLKHDLSVKNFVDSDFTMLNARLARHYGIEGVDGHALHKVSLPANSHRGGVMTMASVLKVTANGTNTSPVVRGVWVLRNILGTPPSAPPDGVPAVEPDIRGAVTIREQLAKHRQVESCAGCHMQIDPPGFALESFDVIGGWRDHYRTVGRGEAVLIDGKRMSYLKGPKVDAADNLPDGRRFADVDEFKRLLLEDKDQLARALTVKLLTYSTGGAPEESDQAEIDAIVAKVRDTEYGLRSLVHAVVESGLFRSK